ncbi:ABC transporter permease [Bacillus subtilis]|nr:ABC transporter permease [Bacillus subtilis]
MTHPNTAAPSNEVKLKENIRKKPETMTRIFFEKFFKNRLAVVGGIILTVIILMAVFAPFIAPYSPESQSLLNKLKPPNAQNLMGTDIFLLITLVTIFQPGMDKLILIFSLTGWTTTARLVRGEFLSLRSREFVLAAKTIGTKNHKIIFSHILPNCIGPIIVSATLKVGSVILAESTLSYLGFGIQPPIASWGNMLQDAQNFTLMIQAWWYPLFPGLFILMTVLCFNFVGDGLRDALDPKNIK